MAMSYDPANDPGFAASPTDGATPSPFEEKQDLLIQQSSRGRQRRSENTAHFGDSNNASLEVELQRVQAEISSGRLNPMEQLAAESKAYAIAERLTSGGEAVLNEEPVLSEEFAQTPAEQYKEELAGDSSVRETLEWSSTAFSEGIAETINDALDRADEVQAQGAINALQAMKKNPDMISREETVSGLSEAAVDYFNSNFSEAISRDVQALNYALVSGKATRAEVTKMAFANPALLNAMLTAANDDSVPFRLAL